jgi:hypothetical protein
MKWRTVPGWKRAQERVELQFILAELELADTFSQIALSTSDRDRANRNRALAKQAYDAARHFLGRAPLKDRARRDVEKRMARLTKLSTKLGSRN